MAEQDKPLLVCDERFRRDKERIERLEEAFEAIRKLDEKLGFVVESLKEEQDRQSSRILALEQKPARRWELVASTVITLVVGGVVGFVLKSAGM